MKAIRLLVAVCVLVPALQKAGAELTLVQDGAPRSVIIVADDASPTVRLAAEELQAHIRLITGAEPAILGAADAAAKSWPAGFGMIGVGESEAGRAKGISTDGLELEHYRIRTIGNALYLLGADGAKGKPGQAGDPLDIDDTQPGTLFAVYHFLGRELGVRWLWPGELGTYAPRQTTLTVGDLAITDGPKLWQRQFRTPKLSALRRRQDPLKGTDMPVYPKDPALAARTAREEALWHRRHFMGRRKYARFGHSFTRWWGRYGREHLDWFALRPDGERGLHGLNPEAVKFCVSNPDVARAVVADWEKSGAPDFFRACPNDGRGYCVCDNCRAMDVPPMQPPDTIDGMQKADRYVTFWNALYEQAVKINPDVVLCSYAYQDQREPPKQTTIKGNILLGYVAGQSSLPDAAASGIFQEWKGWSDAGAKLYFRPNWLYIGHAVPYMPMHESAKVMKFLHENSLLGTDFDGFHHQYAVKGPWYYLLARLHTQPELSAEGIIQEFASAFGSAAGEIARYIGYWETFSMAGHKAGAANIGQEYTDEVMAGARDILDRAAARLAADETIVAQRIAFLRTGLEHVELMAKINRLNKEGITSENMKESIRAAFALKRFREAHAADHVTYPAGIAGRELGRGDPLMQRLILTFGGREPIDVLPEWWAFRWDPEMLGEERKWFLESVNVDKGWTNASVFKAWEHQDIGKAWKEEHGADYDGLAWYRTTFTVPASERGKSISLLFSALDETGRVWMNGVRVGDHANINKNDWKSPFEIEIGKVVRFDRPNTLVVLVVDRAGLGGIWQPVYLMAE
ncbi:MAG: DUF4838 domain-containing protein [Kiritimatiellae bacterium]|nr:DUF4838 domain-containing protein [Kiritimatiellia bacterium]